MLHNESSWRVRQGSALGVAERLVDEAYALGGTDNITAIVVRVM